MVKHDVCYVMERLYEINRSEYSNQFCEVKGIEIMSNRFEVFHDEYYSCVWDNVLKAYVLATKSREKAEKLCARWNNLII